HRNDLRLPWLGTPFVGLANFAEAAADPRFRDALVRTLLFAAATVPIELALGLALALVMHHAIRSGGVVRPTALVPWAIPSVVASLVWRFMFAAPAGVVTVAAEGLGITGPAFDWFTGPFTAWVPIAAADIW